MRIEPGTVGLHSAFRQSLVDRPMTGWLLCCCIFFWISAPCLARKPNDAALQQALAAVVAAQPGSTENAQVADAWKVVAQAEFSQLPLVFNAVDHANGLAANWISMALDRMVERLGAEQLPIEVLSTAALNTDHRLLTRKMALELLTRRDAKLVDDLQPRFLNDPEADLRRPAIDNTIAQARELATQDAPKQQQIKAWLDVLPAARDQDQVLQIARALKELGHEVDLAAHFGYLVDWYVIGPFDNTDGQHFDTVHPPEQLTLKQYETIASGSAAPVAGKSGLVRWKKVRAKATNGDVDLNQEIEKLRDVLAYGAAVFVSDRAQQVDVRLRIQNSFKIWLNGKLLVEQPVGHTGNSFDQYKVRAELRPGKNLFVVKSCQVNLSGATQFYDNWHFCVRVCDSTGGAIPSSDRAAPANDDSIEKGAER